MRPHNQLSAQLVGQRLEEGAEVVTLVLASLDEALGKLADVDKLDLVHVCIVKHTYSAIHSQAGCRFTFDLGADL